MTDRESLVVELEDGGAFFEEALAAERAAVRPCSETKDQIDGMKALLEKRCPIFTRE